MIDLVILGLAAFYLGRNFDNFDFDFSQNQDLSEEPQDTQPARFTEFKLIQEAQDAKYPTDTVSLYARSYVQGNETIFEQFKIERNGSVVRSGYRDYDTALAEFQELIRPRTPEEQARFDEVAAAKETADAAVEQPKKERQQQNTPLTFDRGQQSGGVM